MSRGTDKCADRKDAYDAGKMNPSERLQYEYHCLGKQPWFSSQTSGSGFSNRARLTRLERGENYLQRGSSLPASGSRGRPVRGLQDTTGGTSLANTDISKKGSIAPVISEGFNYTSTDTAVTWTWAGVVLRRADRSQEVIPDGSFTISGLIASTTYYFLPFWPPYGCCKQIGWVVGTAGSPQVAFASAPSLNALWQQTFEDREPLSAGAMTAATAAGGSTSSGGGGGSDAPSRGGTCPRIGQVVNSRSRGIIHVEKVKYGEYIESPSGWARVTAITLQKESKWVLITTEEGEEIEMSVSSPQRMKDGTDKPSPLLEVGDEVLVREGKSGILRSVEIIEEEDWKALIQVDHVEHLYYCGWGLPNIAHINVQYKYTQ